MNEQRSAFMNWTSKTSLLGSRELLAQFLPCSCLQVQRFLMCAMERCRESSFLLKSRFLTEGPQPDTFSAPEHQSQECLDKIGTTQETVWE